jgi:hypothetical protein
MAAGLGPFTTYVPPGVYTRTLTEANAANLVAGLRIPVVIGVGQEELEQDDLELVRGSSANLDQQIVNEDVSARFVVDFTNPNNPILGAANGVVTRFRVRNFPIVDGQGFGLVTNNVRSVSVTINGSPVAVGAVQGQGGYIILQVPPQVGDNIRVTYYFHRSDTAFTDDVSDQVTASQAELTTPGYAPFVITAGVTDTFILNIDGTDRTLSFAAGSYTASGLKTLIDSNLITGLVTAVFTDNQGLDHITFTSARSLTVGTGTANGALGFAAGTTTTRNASFRVFQRPIVDGTDGGITTTDTTKVVVTVNSVQVIASAVDGTNGIVTLPYAPAAGSTVRIQYFANTWQDTFDYLPNTLVTNVIRCGFATGRSDFIQGQDFVVSNPSPDVSILHWGSSYVAASAQRTAGATSFNETQILPTLVDNKMFLVEADRVIDTTVVPALVSTNKFLLPEVPTTGNGRDTPLGSALYSEVTNGRIGLNTNRPDLVSVYTGRNLLDALGRAPAVVTEVDGTTRQITLKDVVPPDHQAFCTFYYNLLQDDTFILTNTVSGPIGTGQFEVLSTLTGTNVLQVRFGVKSGLAETIQWPRGVETVPDAFHTGAGTPVSETVTVTFGRTVAQNAVFTNDGASPYSFYQTNSDQWRTTVNSNPYATNLYSPANGYLVSSRVEVNSTNQIDIPLAPNNVLSVAFGGAIAATGTITVVAGSLLVDTETFTLDDGINTATVFEFDSGGGVTPGNVAVAYTALDTAATVRASVIAAINGVVGTLLITASPAVTPGVINLLNDSLGAAGNQAITDTVADLGFVHTGMSGGLGLPQTNVSLTTGLRTPTQIVSDINTALGSALASFRQIGGTNGPVFFLIQTDTIPAALPGGFDHASTVQIRQGTVETVLGFSTFQLATGTPTATNKPATILGTLAGPFIITLGVNDQLNIRLNGIDYTVTLPAGAAVTAAAVAAAINLVPGLASVASVGTLANLNKVRLTSGLTSPSSSIRILAGSANLILGFVEGEIASQTIVGAQEVTNAINATSGFDSDGVAYVSVLDGQQYVTIESLTTGAAASTIAFATGVGSAFNTTTGTKIVVGISGDNGEDAEDNYTVTSSLDPTLHTLGSYGIGYPGQTYTDARTGLRFSVLASDVGGYTNGGSFTLEISPTWKVNPAIPYMSIPGLETIVTDTVGVGVNDTATLQTFNPGGLEPAIGDFYYVSYRYMKQDFSTRLFQTFKTIEAEFGPLSAENRVTLGAFLAIQNGAVLVGIKQVLKVINTNQASDVSFIQAINDLATPLPGNIKPNVLVPLTTSSTIYAALMQHCVVQSGIRNQAERMGFIGFASGTSPIAAQTVAKALLSNRIIAVYPDSAVITITNELGENYETLVDGTFLAAALAGSAVSPAYDVATPYTRRRIIGFTRLPRILDPVEATQTATSGITVFEDLSTTIRIRHGLTTDMTNVLTRLPTVTQIADYVQQQSRTTLDSFVGTKFLSSRTNEVEVSMTSLFKQLIQAEIVGGFAGISATVDPDDPTVLRFEAFFQPIFPLLYLYLTFNLRSRI